MRDYKVGDIVTITHNPSGISSYENYLVGRVGVIEEKCEHTNGDVDYEIKTELGSYYHGYFYGGNEFRLATEDEIKETFRKFFIGVEV